MQSEQASELAQRQYLMDRLKLEYSLLNGLRKQKTQLKKQVSKTGVSPKSQSQLTGMHNSLVRNAEAYINAQAGIDKTNLKQIEGWNKAYHLQPDIKQAIDEYVASTANPNTDIDNDFALAAYLGTPDGGNVDSNNGKQLRKLEKAFAEIPSDNLGTIQKNIAFDYLIFNKHKGMRFMLIQGRDQDDAREILKNKFQELGPFESLERLSKEDAKTQYNNLIDGQNNVSPGVASLLKDLQLNGEQIKVNIKNWGKDNNVTPVQMNEIRDTIKQTTGSIDSAQQRITDLTSQLDKPKVSTGPQTLSERAGNILFKNELQKIANDRMKQALKNMPDEEKQFYKYYKRAEELSNKGIPDHGDGLNHSGTKKAIDTYIKDYDPNKTTNTNILKDYLNYQKGLEIPEQLKDEMTIRGIARIFNTVKGAVQENEKFEKEIENSFKPKTESKTESKINTLPAPLAKDATLGDTSDNIGKIYKLKSSYNYGYKYIGDEDGQPKFRFIRNGRETNKELTPAMYQEAKRLYDKENR
jgi:beta-phosphoglucomutase-like phosphatase (HAD superfamily)